MASDEDTTTCEYYDHCFGFEDESTITSLDIGSLIIIIFLLIATIIHRSSELEHLLFITSNFYLYFYTLCLINFIIILISVTFFNYKTTYSQLFVGIVLIITSISTMIINIIGCKYYRAYICWKKTKNISLRFIVFFGILTTFICLIIGSLLLHFALFDNKNNNNQKSKNQLTFDHFLLFELIVTILYTSVSAFASKLAQIEWILLIIFTILYVESYFNTEYEPFSLFLVYWHPICLFSVSVITVFGLSPFNQLRTVFLSIFSCFVCVFDLVTDINVIYVWIRREHHIYI